MRVRIVSIISLMVFVFALAVAPAAAVNGSHLNSVNITCQSTTIDYEQVNFDRNNTGEDTEEYVFEISDGDGNQLYFVDETVAVGDKFPADVQIFDYDTPPTANPIRIHFYSVAGNGFEQQEVWDVKGDCADLPPSIHQHGAPGIPAGFVFKTIICNTPVYNTVAGQPVGNAHVDAGQTWYVNPKPVDGADGKSWTEIFVSSTTNPWIPTACVQ